MLRKHLHRNLPQPLPSKTVVERLEAHLRPEAEDARELRERLLVLLCLSPRVISEILQPLSTITLLCDAGREGSILSAHRLVKPARRLRSVAHHTRW